MSKQRESEERVLAQLAAVVGCCSPLARQPRLSVMAITAAQWKEIERLSKR